MPTREEITPSETLEKTEHLPKKLGVIAGGGDLPHRLLQACDDYKIDVFVIGFEGQTRSEVVRDRRHLWTRLGAVGKIIKTLKAHAINDLVLIGSVCRPSISELKPDLKTVKLLAGLSFKALGDNDLLGILRTALEKEGFRIHGVQKFARDLLAEEGLLTRSKPKKEDVVDMKRGLEVSQALGALDVGQSVIVQEGMVLGVEAIEGTDSLIERCKALKRKGRGGVLVKTCKPQQDRDLDLPTIGPETVRLCASAGLAGIAVHAGCSLLLDPQTSAQIADRRKMFIIGIRPEDYL